MVEIHKGICGPELLLQVLTTYYLSSVLDKHGQELKWLLLDSDLDAVLSEFPCVEVHLEDTKAETSCLMVVSEHENPIERSVSPGESGRKLRGGSAVSL
jgi:hypothetical protein